MNTKEILQGVKDWAAPKVIYDISAAHNNTKYTDLSDALGTNGGNIPQEYRKGGITVRYVQTSDNKYVQYRLMKNDWSATITDWQGVDEAPTAGSNNFVKSGGVYLQDEKIIKQQLNYKEVFTIPSETKGIVCMGFFYDERQRYEENEKEIEVLSHIYNIVYPNDEMNRRFTVDYWYGGGADGEKSYLNVTFPHYLFGTHLGTNSLGIEYFLNVYPEACVSEMVHGLKINMDKKALLQLKTSGLYSDEVKTENHTLTLNAEGYSKKEGIVSLVYSNRNNAKSKNIQLLCIGDSITEQSPYISDGIRGSWVMNIGKMAAVDDIVLNGINIGLLGTRNIVTQPVSFNGETRQVKCCSEGRSGWPTYCYLNWPTYARMDGPAPAFGFIGKEAMFYALGLSTKTPFDSSTPGQSAVSYNSSYDEEIIKTPFGRYKVDCTAVLWNQLKSCYSDFPGTGDYNSSTSDPIITAYFASKMDYPTNPFYSKEKAQAYTGSHIWTNDNAFSIDKYLLRYRTCDDLGVTLTGSAGESVTGSDGQTYTIGTEVSDTSAYKVCKPTHVISALGTNDFDIVTYSQSAELQSILHNSINDEHEDIFIGYWLPRKPGVIDVNVWQDYGCQKEIGALVTQKNVLFENLYPSLGSGIATYIPCFYTMSPLGANPLDRLGIDFDDITETKKNISGVDGTHPSAFAHRSIGYECLSWIYWTCRTL